MRGRCGRVLLGRQRAFAREDLVGDGDGGGEETQRHAARRRNAIMIGGNDEERKHERENAAGNHERDGKKHAAYRERVHEWGKCKICIDFCHFVCVNVCASKSV